MQDMLPGFPDDVTATNDELKSDSQSPSWAYTALHRCVVYMCQPWDVDEPRCEFVEDVDSSSIHESVASDQQQSDDARSQQSIDINDINLDYMAYVKRTDSIPSPTNKAKQQSDDTTVCFFGLCFKHYLIG